ncbi:MAG: HIT domain-containing protein [Deltaproteobacteria bacterium]|nr:HIT domain-containing protein [Deltaproteobacteria bacterium]
METFEQSCPFCTLDTTRIIAANAHAIAAYDAYPVTPGHMLIIPKRHITSFFDATSDEQTAMPRLAGIWSSCVGSMGAGRRSITLSVRHDA